MSNIDKFNKKIGRDIIQQASNLDKVDFLKTGIEPLDYIIGGGLPRGRMITFKGLQSVTKTSLSLAIIAEAQRRGDPCVFVDAEYAFNREHAEKLGVNLEELLIITPNASHEALAAMEELMAPNTVFVVDSVPAMATKAEAEATADQITMASQARFMATALRRLTPKVAATNSMVIWINQLRQNIMGGTWDPYIETGGMALKFYTSVGLQIKKKQAIKEGTKLVGYVVELKVVKNKVGPPGGDVELEYYFDEGFKGEMDWAKVGVEKGVIEQRGAYYFWGEENLGQGSEKATEALTEEQIQTIKES
jgi:recombination protein RecA